MGHAGQRAGGRVISVWRAQTGLGQDKDCSCRCGHVLRQIGQSGGIGQTQKLRHKAGALGCHGAIALQRIGGATGVSLVNGAGQPVA